MKQTIENTKPQALYTTSEFMKMVKVSAAIVKALRESGLLEYFRIGKGFCYSFDQINRFADRVAGYDISTVDKIMALGIALKKTARSRRK